MRGPPPVQTPLCGLYNLCPCHLGHCALLGVIQSISQEPPGWAHGNTTGRAGDNQVCMAHIERATAQWLI